VVKQTVKAAIVRKTRVLKKKSAIPRLKHKALRFGKKKPSSVATRKLKVAKSIPHSKKMLKKRPIKTETSQEPGAKKKIPSKTRDFVTEYLENPFFKRGLRNPEISTASQAKLVIKAVLNDDEKMLKHLISDAENIYSVSAQQSPDVKIDALTYALIGKTNVFLIYSSKYIVSFNFLRQQNKNGPHAHQ